MTNRHRFWIAATAAVLMLAGCKVPPPRPYGTQAAPDQSRPLSFQENTVDTGPMVDVMEGAPELAGQVTVKVGLLLPLTGRNAELGRALQDAASISLFDKYARLSTSQNTTRVVLLPKDTGDTPEQAVEAMRAALAEDVKFIIGPVFADAAAAAAPLALAKNISVLSFSNTRTQASPGTYMFGFSPAEQAERVVTFALTSGKSRIAVLAPSSPLGDAVLAATRDAMKKLGLKPTVEARYQPSGGGMEAALASLGGTGREPAYDAIIIPEGGPVLDTIVRGLAARNVTPRKVQFLGTGLWDDTDLLRRVNLDGAWFASSPPALTQQFEGRFSTTYKYAPPRIASLGYDAVALAVTLATSGRSFDATTLTNGAGFAGPANGIFRLRVNGLVQRALAVMQVQGSSVKVISPAPEGF